MRKETIGVIGGCGKVGRETVRYLLRETPHDILVGGRNHPGNDLFPQDRVLWMGVDVFQPPCLDAFCRSCFLLVNCAGPSAMIGGRAAMTALENGVHYVDPGGHNPVYHTLTRHRDELDEKGVSMVLATGILPGLSEIFPIHEAGHGFDAIRSMEYAYIGRD